MAQTFGRVRRPTLVDVTALRSISRDARRFFAGPEPVEVVSASAMVVASPLAKAIGNFFIGLNKTSSPTRLFASEGDALEWLRGFLP
jgi:hypothetical protein